MNKLFIDTNAFEKIGYNFDEKNPIISVMIKNVKDKKYEYYNLSVIDNEIQSHLNTRAEEEMKIITKKRWLSKYISDEDIKKNCYKDLNDYNDFKNKISAFNCDVSKINPEKVFSKYFKIEYPFEKNGKKRKEFPDAFISEYVNQISILGEEKVCFITDDDGLARSLNSNIHVYKDLETFLSDINDISPKEYKKIEKMIFENIELIQQKVKENINLEYFDLEEEEIDVNSIEIQNIINIQVIDNKEGSYYINCQCDFLILKGEFSCLDYNNSYMPNDCDFYVNQEFIRAQEVAINDYEFIIEVVCEGKNNYSFKFLDKYDVKIDYEIMEQSNYGGYSNYDGEDSWSQDGGPYR